MTETKLRIDITRDRAQLLNNIRTIIKQGKLLKEGVTADIVYHSGKAYTITIDEDSLKRDKEALREQLKQYADNVLTEFKRENINITYDKDLYTTNQAISIIMTSIEDSIAGRQQYKESELLILLAKAAVNDYLRPVLKITVREKVLQIPALT